MPTMSPTGSRRRGPVDDDKDAIQEDSPMTLAAKLKNKHKARAKPQSRLSFNNEEVWARDLTFCVMV